MTVEEIVAAYLKEHGYDGLYADYGCGCEFDDLMPCGDPSSNCAPGYRHESPCDDCGSPCNGDGEDFLICEHPRKETT